MSAPWTWDAVGECLERVRLPRVAGLKTRDYQPAGKYPVVDQGKALIAGWTDAADGVISEPLPVVVFGDHSRTFKYIDFPFVRGADGTQVLKPRAGIDTRYFYFACRSLDLASRGYNRHFTLLKEQSIPLPGPAEQKLIARALAQVEEFVGQQERQLAVTRQLKRATAQQLFSRGMGGGTLTESEIGPIPEGWAVEGIGERFDVASGTTPSRSDPRYWAAGTIPWVKTAEVQYNVIESAGEHVTQAAVDEGVARVFPRGTLLLAMYGQGVTRGKVAVLGMPAACNQACAAMTPKDEVLSARYLYHFLAWRYEEIRGRAHGGQQQNLNLDIVRAFPVAYPAGQGEQEEIVAVLDAVDERIRVLTGKQAAGRRLMDVLLRGLMSGAVRVEELDLEALQPEPEGSA